jgi:NADP-dependent 3-hydroxy acid dehydrogenase YdfG
MSYGLQTAGGKINWAFCVLNNAGIGIGGDVKHYSIEDWNQIVDVNLRGVIMVFRPPTR